MRRFTWLTDPLMLPAGSPVLAVTCYISTKRLTTAIAYFIPRSFTTIIFAETLSSRLTFWPDRNH